jgi:hypothetical protein
MPRLITIAVIAILVRLTRATMSYDVFTVFIHMFKAFTIAIMVTMIVMIGGLAMAPHVQFTNAYGEGYDNPCDHAPWTYAYRHGCHGGGY